MVRLNVTQLLVSHVSCSVFGIKLGMCFHCKVRTLIREMLKATRLERLFTVYSNIKEMAIFNLL